MSTSHSASHDQARAMRDASRSARPARAPRVAAADVRTAPVMQTARVLPVPAEGAELRPTVAAVMCAAAELPSEAELVEILKPGTPLRLPQSMWADFVAPMVSATMPEGYWDAKVFNVKDGRATSKNWRVQVARHLAGQASSHTSSLTAATSCPQPHAHSPMPTDPCPQTHTRSLTHGCR